MATKLEKENLEAHVDLCEQRYNNLDRRMTSIERKLVQYTKILQQAKSQ